MIDAQIGTDSQRQKLRNRLQEAGFTHGEEARVDLSGVRVGPPGGALHREEDPTIYFCGIGPVEVTERIEEGDGGPLPEEVECSGLSFSEEGYHRLENVVIRTNGRMRLEADEKTEVRRPGFLGQLQNVFGRLIDASGPGPIWGPMWGP